MRARIMRACTWKARPSPRVGRAAPVRGASSGYRKFRIAAGMTKAALAVMPDMTGKPCDEQGFLLDD
ncbi:MAG TPA: hypothetical protein VF271_00520, partial [Rhodanobacteraceae bacterium]